MPSHKTYVFPTYFPKNGQGDYTSSGFDAGFIRERMENYYEGYWREASYYRANPTNGLNIRGYFMDTKTAGEIAMPWPWNPGQINSAESNVSGVVIGTIAAGTTVYRGTLNPKPVGGRSLTIQIGTRHLTDTTGGGQLAGDGFGSVNHATGAYSFQLSVAAPAGTPILAFYTAYLQGAAPSPAAWANFSAPIGDPGSDRFPDGQGEQFDELADKLTPAVKYQRRDLVSTNSIDDPLVDGVWTPGERFTDRPVNGGRAPTNGVWDHYIHAEDRWAPVHTNYGIVKTVYPQAFIDYISATNRGDFFYDYDFSITSVSTTAPARVLAFTSLVSTNVAIQVADRDRQVNVQFNLSEFDLTPPLFYRSNASTISTNLASEDRWAWTATNRVISNTGNAVLLDPVKTFLFTPGVGDVIADYSLDTVISNNAAGTRVERPTGELASSNVLFYVADLAGGTNIAVRLNELDLTPPQFYDLLPSGPVTNNPAEDRWIPSHSFVGIAATLRQFAPIRNFLDATNAAGEVMRGDAVLDYGFNYSPAFDSWAGIGRTNVTIFIADTVAGTNRRVVVNELDLTPPIRFTSGTPLYGNLANNTPVTSDPSGNLEGDAAHTYVSQMPTPSYTNIDRLGRIEVNRDLSLNEDMHDSFLAVTVRVYLVSALINSCTSAPGTVITFPDPSWDNNRFVFTNGIIKVLTASYNFWSDCVAQTGPASLVQAELPIPLYYAAPVWGKPFYTAGSSFYTNSAVVADVPNPFEDAVGNDDAWTPASMVGGTTTRLPVYGYDAGIPWTADPDKVLEGDASHVYAPDPASTNPAYASVGRLGRFEYDLDVGLRPFVYSAGVGLPVQVYLPDSTVTLCLSNTGTVQRGCMFVAAENRIVVVNLRDFKILNNLAFTTPLPLSKRYPAYLDVPLYYSSAPTPANTTLWGKPVNPGTYTSASGPVENPFEDATVPKDDVWTAGSNVVLTTFSSLLPNYGNNVTADNDPRMIEGDAAWTYIRDTNTPPPNLRPLYGDVARLNRIEYETVNALPVIYQAPYEAIISTYMDLPTTIYNGILAGTATNTGFTLLFGGFHVLKPTPNFFSAPNVAGTTPLGDTNNFRRVEVAVHVPLYYSAPIWGEPLDAATYQSPPNPDPFVGIENIFIDAIGKDGEWTAAVPEESFSDFISWWDPTGGPGGNGTWVTGISGVPTNLPGVSAAGTLPRGSSATPYYWSYARYTNYIWNNYPGDCAGLIARCGDGKYDGPENWAEVDNNQYMQRGFAPAGPTTVTTEPPDMTWDFSVGPPNISSYSDWWRARYGANSTPVFGSSIPNMSEWKPQLTDDNQVVLMVAVTNVTLTGTVVTVSYPSVTHPPTNTTWTYDAPREFDDVSASLYHNPDFGSSSGLQMRNLSYWGGVDANPLANYDGGDLRLGEPTSPWNASIAGQDRGDDIPETRDLRPDFLVPAAGPYAHHTHANYGYDAANQLNLEFATWRTDGQSSTGPRGGHKKPLGYDWHNVVHVSWADSVSYQRDNRDVNLNGLIDQGETIPAGSQNYFVDADPQTPDNGFNTMPLFGWERFIEDVVDTYDTVEDFNSAASFALNRTNAMEWGILKPEWYAWAEGAVATAPLSSATNVLAPVLFQDSDGNGVFTPERDALWIDSNPNGRYDALESMLHGNVANGATPSGLGPRPVRWADLNANGVYDVASDLVWLDDMPGGVTGQFDSEPVLHDLSDKLAPGEGNAGLSNLRTTHSIYVYPSAANISLMWAVLNDYAGPTEIYYGSTNGVDQIYSAPGFSGVAGFTTGVLWTTPPVRYVSRGPNDPGYQPGDDVFIDVNNNGKYDADTAISMPLGQLLLSYTGMPAQVGTFNIGYTTNGSDTNFHRATSVAWLEQIPPSNQRSGEYVLFNALTFTNGTPAFGNVSAFIQWIDLPGANNTLNNAFDPIKVIQSGGESGEYTLGDAVFYDANANGVYDFGASVNIPLYMVGMYNQSGVASPGVFVAGQRYAMMTRERYISGFNQNQPAALNMPSPGLLTHEQSHDVLRYPDLYDYDVSTEEVDNNPTQGGDLMSGGGMVHGYPDLKFNSNPAGSSWPAFKGVTPQELNYGPNSILRRNAGQRTLLLYPVERYADQYYVFRSEKNPREYFTINFNAGGLGGTSNPLNEQPSPYVNAIGRGIAIGHSDYQPGPPGYPQQQRSNDRFTWLYVQADGLHQLEDGTATVEPADAFATKPQTRQFTAQTVPPAVWYDQTDSGLRILDMRLPTDPYGPAEIVVEWVMPTGGAGGGAGTDWYWVPSGVDSDGDGIPDVWEYYWFGRYPNPLAEANRFTDHDGDGLSDYGEWLTHGNPLVQSSWTGDRNANALSDADIDLDGDGLSNLAEVRDWNTRPRDLDSDDDGVLDGVELNRNIVKADGRLTTSPTYGRSPLVERALQLVSTNKYLLPEESSILPFERNPITNFSRLRLTNWTVEAWIYLASTNETGSVVTRETAQSGITFSLAVSNNHPFAALRPSSGGTSIALAPDAVPASNWVHIAGSFDNSAKTLKLYVDGALVSATTIFTSDPGHPGYYGGAIASGTTWLGGGLNGIVDEVRIWSRERTQSEIEYGRAKIVNSPWRILPDGAYAGAAVVNDGSLVVNLRFDDSQNLTNRLDYADPIAFGAEDWVNHNNWNYAVRGTPSTSPLYTSQFVTNHPAFILTDSILDPYDDLNEDNIPDWWQEVYWPDFDPFVSGPWDAANDPEGDGLSNYYEYTLDTNPRAQDTAAGLAGKNDSDKDGLSDSDEVHLYGTDPKNPDTDDDGINDGREVLDFTNPLYSRSPVVLRSVMMTGTPLRVPEGSSASSSRFSLPEWTVEFWLKLDKTNTTGNVMVRTLSGAQSGLTNWAVVVSNNVPYTFFQTQAGRVVRAGGGPRLGTNWTHLAAIFDPAHDTLVLMVDGFAYQASASLERPATGTGQTTIGGTGVTGLIDELRVWSDARTQTQVMTFRNQFTPWSDAATLAQAQAQRALIERIRRTPSVFREYSGSTYEFINQPMTYTQAVAYAASLGGKLASINSAGENSFVAGLAGSNATMWIGMSDAASEGNWVWEDGSTLAQNGFANWEVWQATVGGVTTTFTEPDGGVAQNYAGMWPRAIPANGIGAGGWFDAAQGQAMPFVVEYGAIDIGGLLAWYVFDDGTTNSALYGAEDFIHPLDWRYAIKGVTFANGYQNVTGFEDLDKDGLPDWWERLWFGNLAATATGDDDNDGLDNLSEFLAGTKPTAYDSRGNGLVDYYNCSAANELQLGEIYDDGDEMPRAWEDQYLGPCPSTGEPGLDPFAYDAQRDPDHDGWSNRGEWLGAATIVNLGGGVTVLEPVSTNPLDPTNYPKPIVSVTLYSPATLPAGASTVVEFYDNERMDRAPVATLVVAPGVTSVSTATMTSGHLHEGAHWAIAYCDANANGVLDEGEYAGLAHDFPFYVGPEAASYVQFTLTSKLPGYGRFSWTGSSGVSNATVRIANLSLAGGPTVLTREVYGPRSYFQENDYMREGIIGLPPGSYVAKPMIGGVVSAANTRYFTVSWQPPTVPVLMQPKGETFAFARNELVFALDPANSPEALLQIVNVASGQMMLDTSIATRYLDQAHVGFSNVYRYAMYYYPDTWANGTYKWRVCARNPTAQSDWSGWQTFTLNITNGGTVASQIDGDVYYFGNSRCGHLEDNRYKNLPIIVEAQRFSTFRGTPDGRDSFAGDLTPSPDVGHMGAYKIRGLRQGSYFLVAYIDVNGNRKLDDFEPCGFSKDLDFATFYRPRRIDVTSSPGVTVHGIRIVIHDRDTDNDGLPDGWEWQFMGTLANDGTSPGVNGLTALESYKNGANPQVVDTDGDGLPDALEVSIGSDPANALSDEDGDGIPTALEVKWDGQKAYNPYRRTSNPAGGDLNFLTADTDGDGVSDLAEIAAGSNPLRPDSVASMAIRRVSADSAGLPVITCDYHANPRSLKITYALYASADLVKWTVIPNTRFTLDGDHSGSISFTNTTGIGPYYRVGVWVDPAAQ